MHVIYGLYDPADRIRKIRYVGYTGNGLRRRLWEHMHEAKKGAVSHRHNWVRKLLAEGREPAALVLEEVTPETWQARERHWIKHYRRFLVNVTDGGEGLINPSEEVRTRIAESVKALPSAFQPGNTLRRGIAHSEADKKKIGDGVRKSEKHRAAMFAKRGIPLTAMTEKAALACRGVPKSADHRAKIGASNAGYPKVQGYRWISNGIDSKLMPPTAVLPDGFHFGRY